MEGRLSAGGLSWNVPALPWPMLGAGVRKMASSKMARQRMAVGGIVSDSEAGVQYQLLFCDGQFGHTLESLQLRLTRASQSLQSGS